MGDAEPEAELPWLLDEFRRSSVRILGLGSVSSSSSAVPIDAEEDPTRGCALSELRLRRCSSDGDGVPREDMPLSATGATGCEAERGMPAPPLLLPLML